MRDVRWEMKKGRQEMGDGRRETGDGRQEMGDGRQETGEKRQETGSRHVLNFFRPKMGKKCLFFLFFYSKRGRGLGLRMYEISAIYNSPNLGR